MKETFVPSLTSGFRLQWEPAQNTYVLLYPEGMIKLNTSAAAILGCCDGRRTVVDIVCELERLYDKQTLASDVNAFMTMAIDNGWLCKS